MYTAFNARDSDSAINLMTTDVLWPRAFKGGFVSGHEEVRSYWAEQWREINPHVDPENFYREVDGRILVKVHLIVRSLNGTIIKDEYVGHRFTFFNGLIKKMEISELGQSFS